MRAKRKHFDEVSLLHLLAGIVFLSALVLVAWFVYQYFVNYSSALKLISIPEYIIEEKCDFRRILDGVCVKKFSEVNPKIVAVMIENHVNARPQSGLSEASIVYEVPVEANYTRFMAIYPADAKIDKIGPVRSARPYYLDWLEEYGGAMYMHCGGSPEALEKIEAEEIFDVNEFYQGKYFWRDPARSAPHNIYTSSELWTEAFSNHQITDGKLIGWTFATTTIEQKSGKNFTEIKEITVSFLPPVYEAVWSYNDSIGKYERYQMNRPHLDADGSAVFADVVIAQKVKAEIIDEIGRQKITMIGEGEALVFQNGGLIEGKWVKSSITDRTRFFDLLGREIKLNPGKIWIEIITPSSKISYGRLEFK